jgi:hypothetical protein
MLPSTPPARRGEKGCIAFVVMESSLPVPSTTCKGKNGLGKRRLPLCRLCGCSAVLLEEAVQGGDNLIDLIIEEDPEGGFANSHQLGSMAFH